MRQICKIRLVLIFAVIMSFVSCNRKDDVHEPGVLTKVILRVGVTNTLTETDKTENIGVFTYSSKVKGQLLELSGVNTYGEFEVEYTSFPVNDTISYVVNCTTELDSVKSYKLNMRPICRLVAIYSDGVEKSLTYSNESRETIKKGAAMSKTLGKTYVMELVPLDEEGAVERQ